MNKQERDEITYVMNANGISSETSKGMSEEERKLLSVLAAGENDAVVGEMIYAIGSWHLQRNLVEGSDHKSQFCKLVQEVGELSDNICKKKDIKDDLGDIMVVLINLMLREGVSFADCLAQALKDIAPRKGKMIDGVFVKEADFAKDPSIGQ